jgi:aspartate beta-hydroxylase
MVSMGNEDFQRAGQCPSTMEVVRSMPLADTVTFSTLAAGTRLIPHYGPTNIKLRHQLCIENAKGAQIRVGEEWRSWEQGKCLVIDDSFNHEVVHGGNHRRVVLLVDSWHPELSLTERTFLQNLFKIWGSTAN